MFDAPLPFSSQSPRKQRCIVARAQLYAMGAEHSRRSLKPDRVRIPVIGHESARVPFSWRCWWRRIAKPRMAGHAMLLVLVSLIVLGDSLYAWSSSGGLREAVNVSGTGSAAALLVASSSEEIPVVIPPPPAAAVVVQQSSPVALSVIAPPSQGPRPLLSAFRIVHRLAAGETLGEVAERYGISLTTLIWSNSLESGDMPAIGQELRIPRVDGRTYILRKGDTLQILAERFNISPGAILAFTPNNLYPQLTLNAALPAGQEIFIPGLMQPLPADLLALRGGPGQIAALTAQPAGVVRESETNLREGPSRDHIRIMQLDAGSQVQLLGRYRDWLKVERRGMLGWIRSDLLVIMDPEQIEQLPEVSDFPPPPPRWVWPARGTITSRFGPRWGGFHNGLDIANRAWTPIVAARTGRVKEAGWCRGYGYCVKISHGGGVETHYGHLIDRPIVSVGEEVAAGELIGYMGSTYDRVGGGYSTGVHLHLTILVNGVAVDPLKFLP